MKTSRTIITRLITIILVMCTLCTTVQAASNSVTIYVDGTPVSGVDAWLDESGTVWVADSYKAVRKLFPSETADLYFPDMVEDRQLQDLADSFGYSLKVSDNNAYLTKKGSSKAETAPAASTSHGNISGNSGIVNNYGNTVGDRTDSSSHAYTGVTSTPTSGTNGGYTQDDRYTQGSTSGANGGTTGGSNVPSSSSSSSSSTVINNTTNVVVNNNVTNNTTINYDGGKGNIGNVNIAIDNSSSNSVNSGTGTAAEKTDGKTELKAEEDVATEESQMAAVTLKVYVNGLKVETDAVTLDTSGEVKVTAEGIKKIFPEAKNAGATSSLQALANELGYSYIRNGLRVYLGNEKGYYPIEVVCDGKVVDFPDQQPTIINGRTMVPVRAVAEMLGCEVSWNNAAGAAVIKKGDTTIVLFKDSTTYTVNGIEFALDAPAQIQNGRTVVPIRFVAEALGGKVTADWENPIKVVNITTV